MSDNDSKRKPNRIIEVLKEIPVICSIIIAGAGLLVTFVYNNQQAIISRNKELAILIPKLGDPDPRVRKFGAISLALYGKEAIPALMALLRDEDVKVRSAASESLTFIGGDTIVRDLKRVYKDLHKDENLRGQALYSLGLMRDPETYNLAVDALHDPRQGRVILWDAVSVLGTMRKEEGSKELIEVLPRSEKFGSDLVKNVLDNLAYIEDQTLIGLLGHANEEVRLQTAKILGKLGESNLPALSKTDRENALTALSKTESNDKSEKVRKAAARAITQIKQRYPK
jgi:HEAT repeat protein